MFGHFFCRFFCHLFFLSALARRVLVAVSAAILGGMLGGCFDDASRPLPTVPAGDEEPQLVEALQVLHDAAEQNPRAGEPRGRLAMAYDVNGFPERAIVVYGQAATLAPDEFNWPYFRALLMVRTNNDYAGALASLDAALAVDDTYVPAWLSRGAWLRELDRAQEARTAYERAAELGAGAPAAVGIAHLHLDDGRIDQVVAILEPLNAQTPDPRIDALLARAYRAIGREEDARIASARGSVATSAMQWLDPKLAIHARYIAGFSNRLLHAQNLLQAGRAEDALPMVEELVAERPEDIAAINTLVWAHAALERLDAAKAVVQDGLELYPDEPRLHQMIANAYLQEGDLDNARRHLERVTAVDSGNARALEDLGWLIARQGETEAGVALLERALDNGAPEPKQVLYRLGLLDGAVGSWSKAADRFREAARIDAAFTMAYVHLGRCLAELGSFEEASVVLDWAGRIGTHGDELASARRRLADLESARGLGPVPASKAEESARGLGPGSPVPASKAEESARGLGPGSPVPAPKAEEKGMQ